MRPYCDLDATGKKARKATGDSKLKIRFMTEAEVMKYLISTHDDNNR